MYNIITMSYYESFNSEDTFSLGMYMGKLSSPGDIIALKGDLGTGKTVFSKGFAKGLGIGEAIVSPTFTILQSYEDGRLPFHHMDAYRIGDIGELEEIGIDDCFYGGGVSLIEWADLIEDILPEKTITITIEKKPVKGFDYRLIKLEGLTDEAAAALSGSGIKRYE